MIGNSRKRSASVMAVFNGHHSLVTPIDWKLGIADVSGLPDGKGHHSLVTPIDWKLWHRSNGDLAAVEGVTTRW